MTSRDPESLELMVTLKTGHRFVMEPHAGKDAHSQAQEILRGGRMPAVHESERVTYFDPREVRSVTVQPAGTGPEPGGIEIGEFHLY